MDREPAKPPACHSVPATQGRRPKLASWSKPRAGHSEGSRNGSTPALSKGKGSCTWPHRAKDDPNDILLYEIYKSEAAFNTHRETEHFKTLVLGEAVPLLAFREVRAYSIDDGI